jgi:GNAT superfamily N-acetyltransferase
VLTLLEQAHEQDCGQILALRAASELWLASLGIVQWGHDQVSADEVQRQIVAGEWYVLRHDEGSEGELDSGLAGALRLLWSDEPVWQHDNAFAAYVHGLMVNRTHTGRGIGAELLRWAEIRGRDAGADELRLDCIETNLGLREYYASQGFREVGRRDVDEPRYSAILLAKDIA